MSAPGVRRAIHRYAYADYLGHEATSNVKHEYLDGEIYAMAGGTLEHAVLAVNVSSALSAALRGKPCVVASSDLKVRVAATGLATYPDVTVICGMVERDPSSRDVVQNPTLVVEVTSDSSEDWDRGEKFEHYRQIAALESYVLVSHRARRLECWTRGADGSWHRTEAGPRETLVLAALGVSLETDDVYRNVAVAE
jgi:Uma2 family endonuclease